MADDAPLPLGLCAKRLRLDAVDALLRRLLRVRQRQVLNIRAWKQAHNFELFDADREAVLLRRAGRDAEAIGMRPQLGVELQQLALRACSELAIAPKSDLIADNQMSDDYRTSLPGQLLRLLPPPRRLAPFLRAIPRGLWVQLCEVLHRHALVNLLKDGCLSEIEGRKLAIEVNDLGLRWVWRLSAHRIDLLSEHEVAECTIRGDSCDLLLLASRLEDADTLFFQRKLQLIGDVELGLTARNLLDRLPWELVPLSVRIVLLKFATLARSARSARLGPSSNLQSKQGVV